MTAARRSTTSRALFGALVVVAGINLAVFAVERLLVLPLRVPSASMQPALQRGDRILVRRTHESPRQIGNRLDRGDVLVFRAPHDSEPLTVKRVIGLPGETIEAHEGLIAIDDDTTLVERWLPDSERERGSAAAESVEIPRTTLDEDEVYVLGDNRDQSIDSRTYGPVTLDRVVGSVLYRFWPLDRTGTVDWQ